jgi:hypothetical protein
MQVSARSVLMSGIAVFSASAIAITPVQVTPPDITVANPAAEQAALSQDMVELLAAVQRIAPLLSQVQGQAGPDIAAAAPTASALAFPGLGNAIINTYNAIEPWVAYGVSLAQYAVGWIPGIGWLAPQIGIFYNFGEQIVQTITFNAAYWIGGSISFPQAIYNDILGTANAFIYLANAQLAFWLPPLPPIPNLPWFGVLSTQAAGLTADAVAPANAASDLVNAIYTPVSNSISYGVDVLQAALAPIPVVRIVGDQANILWDSLADPIADSFVYQLVDPVLNQPLNINSYINGAYAVGTTTVNSVIGTALAEASYFLGVPLAASANAQNAELKTNDVASVPSIVKDSLGSKAETGKPARPLAEVTDTIRNVRNDIRATITDRRGLDAAADKSGNDVVRSLGEVSNPLGKDVASVIRGTLRAGKPDKVATDVADAPKTVAKSVGDAAKNVVKNVRQAVKNVRHAAKESAKSGGDG